MVSLGRFDKGLEVGLQYAVDNLGKAQMIGLEYTWGAVRGGGWLKL